MSGGHSLGVYVHVTQHAQHNIVAQKHKGKNNSNFSLPASVSSRSGERTARIAIRIRKKIGGKREL